MRACLTVDTCTDAYMCMPVRAQAAKEDASAARAEMELMRMVLVDKDAQVGRKCRAGGGRGTRACQQQVPEAASVPSSMEMAVGGVRHRTAMHCCKGHGPMACRWQRHMA